MLFRYSVYILKHHDAQNGGKQSAGGTKKRRVFVPDKDPFTLPVPMIARSGEITSSEHKADKQEQRHDEQLIDWCVCASGVPVEEACRFEESLRRLNVESLKQSAVPPPPPLAASGSQEATGSTASLTILTKTSRRQKGKRGKGTE